MVTTITTLPTEIRQMIYNLLIPTETTIAITSPRRKHACKGWCDRYDANRIIANKVSLLSFPTLSLACHQIRREVLSLFYSNRFLVANGRTGCPHESNIQALRHFTKFTSPETLDMIKDVTFQLHFASTSGPFEHGELQAEMKTIHQISRLLFKHFSGLEIFGIDFLHLDRGVKFSMHSEVHMKDEFNKGIKKMMQIVIKEGLRKVQYPQTQAEDHRYLNLRSLFQDLVTQEQKDAGVELLEFENAIEKRSEEEMTIFQTTIFSTS